MDRNNLDIYKTWAPDNSVWAAWAKPVLFASLPRVKAGKLNIPEVQAQADRKTMYILDLPGRHGVEEALAYAARGWQPVPLYNGTSGDGAMLVDVKELGEALLKGADYLKELRFSQESPLSYDSPPIFLLDHNRMNGSRAPGVYDNRWSVFPQDMPSPDYVTKQGIERIIVRTPMYISADLEQILCGYEERGVALFIARHAADAPKDLHARRLGFWEGLAYRFRVTLGLKRNAAGGFGGMIPHPYEGGARGRRYHSYG